MSEFTHWIPSEYFEGVDLFAIRLRMKHKLKGIDHRALDLTRLFVILNDEVRELQAALGTEERTKIIEEALDVMICGLLIVDRALDKSRATGGSP